MTGSHVDSLARSLLYEGYLLYPYSTSSLKNRCRWTFGGVYPSSWREAQPGPTAELGAIRTECLVTAPAGASLDVRVRFLHLADCGNRQEAIERDLAADPFPLVASGERSHSFWLTADDDGERSLEELRVELTLACSSPEPGLFAVGVTLTNRTELQPAADRRAAELRSLASTHFILSVAGGRFVSLADPPDPWATLARSRVNIGLWPALAGNGDTVLAAPIILEDFARIAPESPGDLFDSTEIDEILTLRILTLSDAEKAEMRACDPRSAALLDRVEALRESDLARLHGTLRPPPRKPAPGDRVRLRPCRRADIFDLALQGKLATVESVQEDAEGNFHVAVTVDDDPGRDLGLEGQPGHRFFFGVDEVELVEVAPP